MTTTHRADARRPSVDDERWEAVRRRDRAADGAFYYSVRTTGVYCRPSCAARAGRAARTSRFHATCAEAERGRLPALQALPARTRPALAERQAAAVAEACRLDRGAEEVPSLDALGGGGRHEPVPLPPRVQGVTGVTPKAYADAHRAERVRDELARQRRP